MKEHIKLTFGIVAIVLSIISICMNEITYRENLHRIQYHLKAQH